MKHKLLCLLLAGIMLFSLGACGTNSTASETDTAESGETAAAATEGTEDSLESGSRSAVEGFPTPIGRSGTPRARRLSGRSYAAGNVDNDYLFLI